MCMGSVWEVWMAKWGDASTVFVGAALAATRRYVTIGRG
jgi:hypothetical protein